MSFAESYACQSLQAGLQDFIDSFMVRMSRATIYLLLLFISACASPQAQPYRQTAQNPVLESHQFIASDGTVLPVRAWLPHGRARAVIVALHGFNDYSRGFEIPGEYMRLRGVALYSYDQRGFGLASSAGIWAGQDNLIRDVGDMVKAVRARYPDTPIYLLGESMGGAVAIAAVTHKDFPPVDGLILSAPAIWGGETMNPLFRIALWVGAHTVPAKKVTGENLHILASDNIDMLRAFGTDPKVIKATRLDAIYELVRMMDAGYADAANIKIPTLLLYGAHDMVIPPQPIHNVMLEKNSAIKVAYYPLGYHMLLRDLHGDVPVLDILAWMGEPDHPLPSGHDRSARKYLK